MLSLMPSRPRGGIKIPAAVRTAGAVAVAPTSYTLDFTTYGTDENPISDGGIWTNADSGTGGNSPLAPNHNMQIRESADASTRICCETVATNDYDDSLSFVPGFSGNQRVEATVYIEAGYASHGDTNHELAMELGCRSWNISPGVNHKRTIHIGFNYAGGFFVAGFDGDLVSWQLNSNSGIWGAAVVNSGVAPLTNDVVISELNRTAKTLKVWQKRGVSSTLVIDLQWNSTAIVDAYWQAVLNDLGSGAGLGALKRIGADAVQGKFGWKSISISSTLLGTP